MNSWYQQSQPDAPASTAPNVVPAVPAVQHSIADQTSMLLKPLPSITTAPITAVLTPVSGPSFNDWINSSPALAFGGLALLFLFARSTKR